MNILDNILQNITYVLFPLTLYLIYFAYIKNMDLEEKSIFLEILRLFVGFFRTNCFIFFFIHVI